MTDEITQNDCQGEYGFTDTIDRLTSHREAIKETIRRALRVKAEDFPPDSTARHFLWSHSYEAAEAAISAIEDDALLNAQKWREIDDEARNGKPWLLYRDGEQFIGKWYPNSKEFGISAPVTEGEVRVWQSIGPRTFAEIIVFKGPTHYAPLPSPPQEKENGDV